MHHMHMHGLKRSLRSCPRRVNAGNKNTPSMHHPRRRNVTTLMVGLKNGHHTQKSHPKVVNPRDIAGERKKKNNNKTTTTKQQQQKKQKKSTWTLICDKLDPKTLFYRVVNLIFIPTDLPPCDQTPPSPSSTPLPPILGTKVTGKKSQKESHRPKSHRREVTRPLVCRPLV